MNGKDVLCVVSSTIDDATNLALPGAPEMSQARGVPRMLAIGLENLADLDELLGATGFVGADPVALASLRETLLPLLPTAPEARRS